MLEERCRSRLIINTLAAAFSMWAALTCCSAVHRQKDTIGGSHGPNVLGKVVLLGLQRKAIFIIIVTGLM